MDFGGGECFWGGYPRSSPPCMNPRADMPLEVKDIFPIHQNDRERIPIKILYIVILTSIAIDTE